VIRGLDATQTGDREDLTLIAEVFGITPVGEDMQRITGLSPASLSRLSSVPGGESRQWRHIATVAAVAKQLMVLLEGAGHDRYSPDVSRRWLHSGTITIDGQPMRPIDALSKQAWTVALLDDLVAANRR
jgi:hypothetical protein